MRVFFHLTFLLSYKVDDWIVVGSQRQLPAAVVEAYSCQWRVGNAR